MVSQTKWLLAVALAAFVLAIPSRAEDKKEELPKKVADALKAKFPKAEITKWTKEKEEGKVVYDIEFKQGKQKFEADIFEDGTLHNWEKEIDVKDLPKAVKEALDTKYPKATLKDVMEMIDVKDGKDVLHGYEITLVTENKKELEVTFAPDGKVLEVEEKKAEKKEEKK
jgi:hypothetical protein